MQVFDVFGEYVELLYCFNLSLKHFCEYMFLTIFADPVLWSWVSVLFCHPFQSSQQVSLLELVSCVDSSTWPFFPQRVHFFD